MTFTGDPLRTDKTIRRHEDGMDARSEKGFSTATDTPDGTNGAAELERDASQRQQSVPTVSFRDELTNQYMTAITPADGQWQRIFALSHELTDQSQPEHGVRVSEERFRKIYEHAATGIAITDREGRFQQCNPAYCRIVGYTEEELCHLDFGSLIHPDDRGANLLAIQELREEKAPFRELEIRYVLKDGRSVWVRKFMSLLRDRHHAPTHVIALVTDITDRQQAEILISSQNRSLEMIVTGSPLSSVLTYLALVVEKRADKQAIASILLLDEEGNLRNGASPSLPDHYLQAIDGLRPCIHLGTCCAAAATGEVVITPDIETDPDWASIKHLPLTLGYRAAWSQPLIASDGHVLGTFGTYFRERRGPTPVERQAVEILARTAALAIERSRGEEALRNSQRRLEALSDKLEQLVEERTGELMQSQTRLRELASELNLAEQRERKRLATELHDHLQQLLVLSKLKLGQGKRLAKPIPPVMDILQQTDDVLSEAMSYTRSLVAELSPPVLREHGLVAGLKWLAEWMQRHELRVTVESEHETIVLPEAQAVLLFQSVRELLINAAKHAKCNRAWVEVTQRDVGLCLSVRDEGAGFDWEAAVQNTPGQSSKFGLFSIRERMKSLGGTLDIVTAPGLGTTCLLQLPLVDQGPPKSAPSLSPIEASNESNRPTHKMGMIGVILVDDHAMIREGLRAVLANYPDILLMGEAADGEEAISLVHTLQPPVVIMDINMPRLNGIEATARIKADFPGITIIGLSVNTETDNQEAMQKAGAALLLTKEAAVDELYQAIQSVLKRSGYQGLVGPGNQVSTVVTDQGA